MLNSRSSRASWKRKDARPIYRTFAAILLESKRSGEGSERFQEKWTREGDDEKKFLVIFRVRSEVYKYTGRSSKWNFSRSELGQSQRRIPAMCLYVSRRSSTTSRIGFHFVRTSRDSTRVSFPLTISCIPYIFPCCILQLIMLDIQSIPLMRVRLF